VVGETVAQYTDQSALWLKAQLFHATHCWLKLRSYCHGFIC